MGNSLENYYQSIVVFLQNHINLFVALSAIFIVLLVLYWFWLFMIQKRASMVKFSISVPRDNPGAPFAIEQAFASLHTKRKKWQRFLFGAEHYAFEKEANENEIFWSIVVPKEEKTTVEKIFASPYINCEIKEEPLDIPPYEKGQIFGMRIKLKNKNFFPIKTLKEFENSEPEASFANSASFLKQGEYLLFQENIKPVLMWRMGGNRMINSVRDGVPYHITNKISSAISSFISSPPPSEQGRVLTERETQIIKAIDGKITKPGYRFEMRIFLYLPANDKKRARVILNAILGYLYQFNIELLNGFEKKRVWFKKLFWWQVKNRYFNILWGRDILNIEELGCIWHLPNSEVKNKKIRWAGARAHEAEPGIPTFGGPFLGYTGENKVCIKFKDEAKGVVVGGAHRTGKTTMIKNAIVHHLYKGDGLSVYDPADDLWHEVPCFLPADRVEDLVLFDPTDLDNPIGMNFIELEEGTLAEKNMKIDDVINCFNHLWRWDERTPRAIYILRGCLKTLLELPQMTLLEVTLLLIDEDFRKSALAYIQTHSEPSTQNDIELFWYEFNKTSKIERDRHISPILNKIGAFTQNDILKLILGQTHSTIKHRKLFDEGKVIVYNLSLSKVGEESVRLLGTIALTMEWQAAKSRGDLLKAGVPPKIHITFVDEFARFAQDFMAKELSMITKYGVYFWISHQYITQFVEKIGDDRLKNAIFANQQNFFYFRVGAEDADFLSNFYEPIEKDRPQRFTARDFTERPEFECIVKIIVDGNPKKPFILKTEPSIERSQFDFDTAEKAKEHSISNYTKPREEVLKEIEERRDLVRRSKNQNSQKDEISKEKLLKDMGFIRDDYNKFYYDRIFNSKLELILKASEKFKKDCNGSESDGKKIIEFCNCLENFK